MISRVSSDTDRIWGFVAFGIYLIEDVFGDQYLVNKLDFGQKIL